ncbi:MAG: hypothetical protein GX213_14260 [Clostridiaceae bacterium]|nr:hypothetical protein [Clostridiaceae bacterium]
MDSEKLKEIRNNIAVLPVLRERAEKLRTRIREAEREIETLLEKYRKECLDVEQLKNNSFSAFLLKIVGKYQGKLEKEEQEILAAKLEYDRTCQQAEEFKKELHELELRIIELKGQERIYETEIKKREQMLLSKMNTEASEQYTELNQEHEFIQKQLVEMDEAIRTANRAKSTAGNVLEHLNKAESWANYDVWVKGGIFSHMAKYDHIDRAEADFNRLSSQLKELRKELSDININYVPGLSDIDSTTRTMDFWFDNIFTDLKVRNRIRDNIEQVRKVHGILSRVITNIESKKRELNQRVTEIEYQKNELILSL